MSITRQGLGRIAGLGALYDARLDMFVNDSILKVRPTEDMVDSYDLGSYFVEIIMSDKFTDKATSLGIEAELQASILSGLIKLKGSGKYLMETSDTSNYMSMDLTYKVETLHEEITLRQLKEYIDMDAFQTCSDNSTHVVVGIDWGANCIVSCQYSNTDGRSESEIKGAFGVKLTLMKGALEIEGKVEGEFKNQKKDISKDFTFSVKSDLTPVNSQLPVSFDDAISLARGLPEALKSTNNGKGIPMLYHMKPLDQVVKMCKFDLVIRSMYKSIQEMVVKRCMQALEEILTENAKFKDLLKLFRESDFLGESTLKEVEDINKEFELLTCDFRTRLQESLQKVRSGEESVQLMDKIHSDFTSRFSQLSQRVKKVDPIKGKLTKAADLNQKGIVVITRKNINTLDLLENGYVLYGDDFNMCTNENEAFRIFCRLLEIHHQSNCKFLVVLREIIPDKCRHHTIKTGTISFYKNKEVYPVAEEMILSEKSFCHIKAKVNCSTTFTEKKSPVRLMFENEFYKTDESKHKPLWICSNCNSYIEYAHETKHLYCQCGELDAKSLRFFNQDILLYSSDHDKLLSTLDKLPKSKEINILILGETGVGKSTWINGIFNYFLYENIDEALKNDINVPIPSQFQFEEKTIFVGKRSPNENVNDSGESCTQKPKLYTMIHKTNKINVIDTPGVGDSRGIEQDKVNFDNILAFLTNFDKLHGVCILMKPNMTRNSLWFRFCIEELLTHLHSSIVKNIIFCFTNARSTFYKPGDTLPILKNYLKKKEVSIEVNPARNCLCFDNEAFRYLACRKNNVSGLESQFKLFDESWMIARKETLRMLDYIYTLPPHEIADTISVNSAREAILQIAKPLAEMVNRIIPENIRRAEEVKKQLSGSKEEIGQLESILKVEGKSFKVEPLPYPRTVCTGEGCWRYESGGIDDSESRKVYHKICHDKCTIEGLPTEAANDERLSKCRAFQIAKLPYLKNLLKVENDTDVPGYKRLDCTDENCKAFEGESHFHFTYDTERVQKLLSTEDWLKWDRKFSDICQECDHSYKLHMHITYDLKTVPEIFIKPEIQDKIRSKKTEKERFDALNSEYERKIEELQDERTKIFNAQIEFGSFIKRNAMIPYNDTFHEMIKMTIKDEEGKGDEKDEVRLARLRQDLEIYEQKKTAIDSACKSGSKLDSLDLNILTPDTVLSQIEVLKDLKHTGRALKDALDGINLAKKMQHNRMNLLLERNNDCTNIIVLSKKAKKGGVISSVKEKWKNVKSYFQ